jgi:ABC-type nitrate/sulfonate/bicarbonate transport system permease component
MIAAEVICQPKFGVGTRLQQERMLANIPELIAWGIIAIIFVGMIERLVSKIRPA